MIAPTGWLKNCSCVKLSGFSRDTFSRRRIPWCEERIPGRIRSKLLVLGPDAEELPRFFLPDVQAFMMSPRMRSALEFVPVFSVPSAAQDNSFHTPTADEPVVVPVCWRIEQAAQYLDVCRDTIELRMIDWQDEAIPYRIRCGRTELKIGRNFVRVCYRPDVEALLKVPGLAAVPALAETYHQGRTHKVA